MNDRLPARLEATAIMRRTEAEGGFATILRRGDADSGAITLLVAERGRPVGALQRRMGADFAYHWTEISPFRPDEAPDWRDWTQKHAKIDPDSWLIELDVADAERFIAETTASG